MHVTGKLILSAAIALTAICASAQGPDPAAPTRREILRAASPIAVTAIERLEARRGAPIGDDELGEVAKTEAFRLEYEKALAEFCAAPEHKTVLTCVRHTAKE